MPNSSLVAARVLARIAASTHTLTVHYPPARVGPSGTAPAVAPTSLLNPPVTAHAIVESDPTPAKPPVTMACLWMDAGQWGDVRMNASAVSTHGWVAGADALARVSAADAESGDVFLGTDHVTHRDGREYKVISIVPMGASFDAPSTYTIWLKGAWKH